MGGDGFLRTLAFGALAALGLPVAMMAAGPVLGAHTALGLYLVLVAAGYLAVLAVGARQRVAVGLAAGVAGTVFVALAPGPGWVALGLAAGVSAVRSGLLYRQGTLRAVVCEAALGVAALAAGDALLGPGLLAHALALWAWFVVQSAYFLVGGLRRRRDEAGDPFERARERMLELLDA